MVANYDRWYLQTHWTGPSWQTSIVWCCQPLQIYVHTPWHSRGGGVQQWASSHHPASPCSLKIVASNTPMSSPYYPQGNEFAEAAVKIINDLSFPRCLSPRYPTSENCVSLTKSTTNSSRKASIDSMVHVHFQNFVMGMTFGSWTWSENEQCRVQHWSPSHALWTETKALRRNRAYIFPFYESIHETEVLPSGREGQSVSVVRQSSQERVHIRGIPLRQDTWKAWSVPFQSGCCR